MPGRPYIMDGPHWTLGPPSDLGAFFRALRLLVPLEGFLGLAQGLWWDKVRDRIASFAVDPGPAVLDTLTDEFDDADFLLTSKPSLDALASLSREQEAPGLFIFLVLFTRDGPVLEWFDAPTDPMSIAGSIPRGQVVQFAQEARLAFNVADHRGGGA